MKMTLKSFPKFEKYQEKLTKQLGRLQTKIQTNEEEVTALTAEYLTRFTDGLDTDDVAEKLGKLRQVSSILQGEVDIINGSDMREKDLARAVHSEFRELEAEVNAESERLFYESEKIKDEAEAAIHAINQKLEDMYLQLNQVARDQLAPVAEHLENESIRNSVLSKINGGLIGGYSSVKNIER